ncbi:MAG: arginine--tRNA ligase [Candidatus Zambryskibacteria bacterium CG10_big_fil_rev_8_21_14_0_10_42_12]|uniref:Arginine--tRNA ligase n=1 Tax=Candidatus Zambryskibacteria bacterium CG10_big_fil_rev_8_21_14_0_10_42_12 TaxID=1975115 RepID=A0A2H0QWZ8_9BACT|nr:MAG: arginine--tRNA ligase [Candidatus Zambryskibacteria bacterium CG10_big_fil_rev_8_21_14_0_10_42_12]
MQDAIKQWVKEILGTDADFAVEYPAVLEHGDYAVNIAMVEAKKEGKNTRELAESYKEKLDANLLPDIEKIEVAGPGFINIFLKKEFFGKTVGEILEKRGEYGKNKTLNKKISYEYTNTNVLKPMHIGHLMGNVIGESLSRIAEWNGADVLRNTYQGDVGLHIAKTIWGLQQLEGIKDSGNLSADVTYVGEAYAKGAAAYEDDELAQAEIKEINKKVYDGTDTEIEKLKDWAKDVSLRHFRELYKILGTTFDDEMFESEVAEDALTIVNEYKEKGIFEESDDAIVFNGKKYDEALHTRVFVTSQGVPTYEAKDIAHALRKYKKYHFDESLIITANEQDEYFKVVLTALAHINPEIAEKTTHISHGMLKLTTGKMSSRTGNIITGEALLEQSFAGVQEKIQEEKEGLVSTDDVQNIGVAAIKYTILKQAPGRDIIFDFEKSLSFEGDSGPYLQYTAVRTKAIKEKAKTEGVSHNVERSESFGAQTIERMLHRFPEVVKRAHTELAPQAITTYLIELASAFNTFYGAEKIVDKDDVNSPYKLALTEAVGQVVRNGLYLLGIKTPEKM